MKIKKLKKSLSLPRNMEMLGQNNSSSIFQDIYNRTVKKENNIQNFSENKTEQFLNIIENMRLREEMIETEKDYIIKESRKEIKLNKEMLYLFGKRRGNYKKTTKKFGKIKLDKNIFINPLEKKEDNNFTISKGKNKINLLRLPIITKGIYNIKSISQDNKLFNSEGNIPNIRKISFNDSINTNIDESKKINESNSTFNYNKKDKKVKLLKRNKNSFLNTSTPRRPKNKHISYKSMNTILKNYSKFSEGKSRNDFAVNIPGKKNVISLLDNINNELKSDEKKHEIYFRKNDYGCGLSKVKINYLEKYFFQFK
mgnify:CR=1 FL=1